MARGEGKLAVKRAVAKRSRTAGRPRAKANAPAVSPREAILKVASELFAQKGYVGTTMAEIADVVGIRGPSLYYHFRDKSDMLRALAEVGLRDTLRDSTVLRNDSEHPVPVRLYYLVHELIVRLRSAPYDMSVLFDPSFRTKQFADVNKRISQWLADLEFIINEGVASTDLVAEDPKASAYMVRGVVLAAIPNFGTYADFTAQGLADYVSNFCLRALLRDQRQLPKIEKHGRLLSMPRTAQEEGRRAESPATA